MSNPASLPPLYLFGQWGEGGWGKRSGGNGRGELEEEAGMGEGKWIKRSGGNESGELREEVEEIGEGNWGNDKWRERGIDPSSSLRTHRGHIRGQTWLAALCGVFETISLSNI